MANNAKFKSYISTILPKPKLKRSENIEYSIYSGPTTPPFEIKTKTITDCAILITKQQNTHYNRSRKYKGVSSLYNPNAASFCKSPRGFLAEKK